MDTTKRSRIAQLLGTTANVHGHEIKAVAGSFFFVVLLMSAYYILRPVRDAMASDWSDAEVSWLWTLNFFISRRAGWRPMMPFLSHRRAG